MASFQKTIAVLQAELLLWVFTNNRTLYLLPKAGSIICHLRTAALALLTEKGNMAKQSYQLSSVECNAKRLAMCEGAVPGRRQHR